MIPIRDENPLKIFPFVTLSIIIANFFVYLYQVYPEALFEKKIFLFGAIPYRITHANPAVWMTLITSLFIHGDLFHLLGNMLYLWVFGSDVEERLGHLGFIFFYFACGIIASLAFIVIVPNSWLPLIGASGAISGILGAYFLLYPHARLTVVIPLLIFWRRVRMPAFWFLLIWIGLQLSNTIGPAKKILGSDNVGWVAHLSGFVIGAFLLTLFSKTEHNSQIKETPEK